MNPTLFTEEQIKALWENPYTEFVSASTLRYTSEFKEMFISELESGKTARRIFKDAGYAPEILGESRMKSFARRVRKEKKAMPDSIPDIRNENSILILPTMHQ